MTHPETQPTSREANPPKNLDSSPAQPVPADEWTTEFEVNRDGCCQYIASTLLQAQAFAASEGAWAFTIHEVRRRGVPVVPAAQPAVGAADAFNPAEEQIRADSYARGFDAGYAARTAADAKAAVGVPAGEAFAAHRGPGGGLFGTAEKDPVQALVQLAYTWNHEPGFYPNAKGPSRAEAAFRDALKVVVDAAAHPSPAVGVPDEAPRCSNCDGTGDVHSIDGEWRGICHCPAGQALRATHPSAPPAGYVLVPQDTWEALGRAALNGKPPTDSDLDRALRFHAEQMTKDARRDYHLLRSFLEGADPKALQRFDALHASALSAAPSSQQPAQQPKDAA